jgi:hypothetical protein
MLLLDNSGSIPEVAAPSITIGEIIGYIEYQYRLITNNLGNFIAIGLAGCAYYSLKVKNTFTIRL